MGKALIIPMLRSVQFNYQLRLVAKEIHNEVSNYLLPLKSN